MSNQEELKEEVNVKELRLMSEISKIIGRDNGNTVHPVWEKEESLQGDKMVLHLFTYNERNDQTFLMKSASGNSKAGVLTKILNYLSQEFATENSYTVIWKAKESKEQHTSYFSAKDVWEVLEKFYFAKEREDAIIFELKLNPIS